MCANNCIGKTIDLTVKGNGLMQQEFQFPKLDEATNYSILELRDTLVAAPNNLLCCQDIGQTNIGIRVVFGGITGLIPQLEMTQPIPNRPYTIVVSTTTINKPRVAVLKENDNFFFIGIDDVRGSYDTRFAFFRFKLYDTNHNNAGVNIQFLQNSLIISGGYY